jgi:hypothetical protein
VHERGYSGGARSTCSQERLGLGSENDDQVRVVRQRRKAK